MKGEEDEVVCLVKEREDMVDVAFICMCFCSDSGIMVPESWVLAGRSVGPIRVQLGREGTGS